MDNIHKIRVYLPVLRHISNYNIFDSSLAVKRQTLVILLTTLINRYFILH